MAKELELGERLARARGRRPARRAPAHLAEPERPRRACSRPRIAALYLEHGFERDRAGDRRRVQREDRVRALEPRRLQDRAPGGARALGQAGALHGARGRGPAARPAVRLRRARRGRPARRRPRLDEEGRRAGGRARRRSTSSASCPSSSSAAAGGGRPRRIARMQPPVHLKIDPDPRLQVVPGRARDRARAGRRGRRRPERLGQVEHRGRRRLGGRLADAVRAPRGEARRRPLRRRRRPQARRALRGRARLRQRGRRLRRARLQRGLDRPPARPRRRGPVPREPRARPAHRSRGAARRRRARLGDALDRRPGEGRAGARLEAGGPARARRGGGGAREVQAPPAPGRAQARARRAPGRARARRRGRGAQAAAAARAPGDRGRARREARGRDRVAARAGRRARPRRRRAAARPRPRSAATRPRSRAAARSRRLEGLLADRARAEDELSDAAGQARSARSRRSTGSRAACERLALRGESATALRERLEAELAALAAGGDGTPQTSPGLEREARRDGGCARARRRASGTTLAEQARLAPRAPALASSASSRSRKGFLLPRVRSRSGGAKLALGALEVEPGAERAVAAALRAARVGGPRRRSRRRRCELLERARAEGLGSLTVLAGARPAGSSSTSSPSSPRDALLDATRAVRDAARASATTPTRGELWFAGETAEAVLLELEARRRELAAEAARARAQARPRPRARPRRRPRRRACRGGRVRRRRAAQRRPAIDRELSARIASAARAADASGSRAAQATAGRFDAPLRARVDAGALQARRARRGAAAARRRRGRAPAASSRRRAERVTTRRGRARAASRPRPDDARRRLEAAGAEPAEGDDRDELAARAERLETRRATLGQVNPLAPRGVRGGEGAADRSPDAARGPRARASRSSNACARSCRKRSSAASRRRSTRSRSTSRRSRRRSSPAARGACGSSSRRGEDGPSTRASRSSCARPGKRITRLSLLSGGEKALGAISFLFALFLARPCAFYLLDEVEAALDDTNIARFVELLRRYSDRAQFVVVTHQKRTMEAADVLYGVTMGPDGVSQVVSRRLPRAADHAAEHAAA